MIIKLHGTSGSGKTTIARDLMGYGVVKTILHPANRKPEAYQCSLPSLKQDLYVLGPYTATCGGLDSMNDVDEHIRLLLTYGQLGHVFYEGLLGSEYYGRIGKASEVFGDKHVFAFLDTPIETCIDRIKERRVAARNFKVLNESNTRGRVKKIDRLKQRLLMGDGIPKRPVVDIDHTVATDQLYSIYRKSESL